MSQPDRFVPLAVIRHAHGVRGEVKIAPLSKDNADFLSLALQTAAGTPFTLAKTGTQPDYVICRIEGITDRNAAEALRGTQLGVMRSSLKEEASQTLFADELIGLRVEDEHGNTVGMVRDIVNYGASDIVVIDGENGSELMLPFSHHYFPTDAKDGMLRCMMPETIRGDVE